MLRIILPQPHRCGEVGESAMRRFRVEIMRAGHWVRVCTTASLRHALCEAAAWADSGYEVDVRRAGK